MSTQELINKEVENLPEPLQREVYDFARFLHLGRLQHKARHPRIAEEKKIKAREAGDRNYRTATDRERDKDSIRE